MTIEGTEAKRVQRRRDKLQVAGLQPVQVWVPDTRAVGFAAECAQQAQVIRTAEAEADDGEWPDTAGWTA